MDPTAPGEPELRLDAILSIASVVLAAAGGLTALAGVQVVVFFEVGGAARFAPWAMLSLGAACVGCVPGVVMARKGPAVAALLATGAAALLHVGWLVWAWSQGVLSLLQVVATGSALLAVPFTAATVPSAWRYQRARAAMLGDVRGDDSPWPMLVSVLVTGALAGPFVFMVTAPLVADRLWLQLGAVAAGRWPSGASVFVADHEDFPYRASPFETYLATEAAVLPLDVERARAWVDDIAWEVGERMLQATGASDVGEAERALWAQGDPRQIPLWIAAAVRARGTSYHLESLLGRSFDPAIHRAGAEVHLDCDQLVYVFAHVGWRLDLDTRPVPAPMHVYLRYQPPAGAEGEALVVETTGFRDDDDDSAFGSVDPLFFPPPGYHRQGHGGVTASRSLIEASALFEPADEARVTDLIVGELAYGLMRRHPEVDVLPMLRAELPGTRDYTLVSNLRAALVEAARARLSDGHPAEAAALAREAAEVRRTFPDLVVDGDRTEAIVLVQALAAQGDANGARAAVVDALRACAADGYDPWRPRTRAHRQLVELADELGVQAGTSLDP